MVSTKNLIRNRDLKRKVYLEQKIKKLKLSFEIAGFSIYRMAELVYLESEKDIPHHQFQSNVCSSLQLVF